MQIEDKEDYFFNGKTQCFDIYFSKDNQMLKIISERGEKYFIIFSYFFPKPCTHVRCFYNIEILKVLSLSGILL